MLKIWGAVHGPWKATIETAILHEARCLATVSRSKHSRLQRRQPPRVRNSYMFQANLKPLGFDDACCRWEMMRHYHHIRSWKWKMGAWKMTLVSKGAIFHFHDYGRKGNIPERLCENQHGIWKQWVEKKQSSIGYNYYSVGPYQLEVIRIITPLIGVTTQVTNL